MANPALILAPPQRTLVAASQWLRRAIREWGGRTFADRN